ncbi:gluconokinase [Maribacter chungangensis]|uniref:Gluconokinase n=1 Tax=Maribacter chungangensis TaxID=1069117 RepID=A0ABW3B4Z4_9FLAO
MEFKHSMNRPKTIYVMGVSGSGKSTVGSLLAERLGYAFFDGDDFHPKSNIIKMSRGEALNDTDRQGWLERLNQIAKEHEETGAVIVCSALKETYRKQLKKGLENGFELLYLKGNIDAIRERLLSRKGHFMPLELLQSQFDTLEEPSNAIIISILKNPEQIVNEFMERVFF